MRVWLIENRNSSAAGTLNAAVQQLSERPGLPWVVVGRSDWQRDLVAELRTQTVELVLVAEPMPADEGRLRELFDLEVAVVLAVAPDRCESFRPLAELYPVVFLSSGTDGDGVWLALESGMAALRRNQHWKEEARRLQQRLNDRIVIERAKGILTQRLGISEEEAYRRLRLLSRKQRRQVREIAQSLLDAEALLTPEENGVGLRPLMEDLEADETA